MTIARTLKALAIASALLQAPAALGQAIEPGAFNHDFLLTSARVDSPLDLTNLDPGSKAWPRLWGSTPPTRVNLMWKIVSTVNQEVFSNTSGTRVLTVRSVNDGATIAFLLSF
jgi:hypothetical protein